MQLPTEVQVMAVEIPDAVVAGIIGIGIAVFIGLASWALLMLVKLSTVVAGLEARLEERSEDHERRLTVLEALAATRALTNAATHHDS